jgi:hypothetical protein
MSKATAVPFVNRTESVSPVKPTPAKRSGLEVAEARAPLAEQELAVFLDDAADLIEFMLFESFVAAQSHRLQPEFTGVAGLFNVDMRRFKFICKVEVEPIASFTQHRRHEWIVIIAADTGVPWKERFRQARMRRASSAVLPLKRPVSRRTAAKARKFVIGSVLHILAFGNGGIESEAAAWSKRGFAVLSERMNPSAFMAGAEI